jgi:hypothetical protein
VGLGNGARTLKRNSYPHGWQMTFPPKTTSLARKFDCAVMGRTEEAHYAKTTYRGADHRGVEGCPGRGQCQDLCRKHGISDPTFYKWRTKYAGLEINGGGASAGHSGAEGDHRKKLVRPKAKMAAAQEIFARFGLSQRRVCWLVDLDRNTLRYRGRRRDDSGRRARMREIAEPKRQYGCPRIYVRLRHVKSRNSSHYFCNSIRANFRRPIFKR